MSNWIHCRNEIVRFQLGDDGADLNRAITVRVRTEPDGTRVLAVESNVPILVEPRSAVNIYVRPGNGR